MFSEYSYIVVGSFLHQDSGSKADDTYKHS